MQTITENIYIQRASENELDAHYLQFKNQPLQKKLKGITIMQSPD
ncbi:MAG: hypothetical protein U5K51_10660 [Flavobacteriaceae bacterium]|nr:hypothetical protein [Flavobacteriaceae bacterium]